MAKTHALIDAIKSNDVKRVRAVLASSPALLNTTDAQGNTPVLTALYFGKRELLSVLLRHKPRLSLFEAAALGDLKRVKATLTKQPRLIRAYSHDGFTALHLAVFFRRGAVARDLLTRKPDVNAVAKNPMRVQPLHSAAAGNDLALCKLLLKHGAAVNARQQGGFTPLHAAAQNGNAALVTLLLNAGADALALTDDGKFARDFAAADRHTALLPALTPPIGAFNRVIVFVKDMARSRAFYEEVLGLRPDGYTDATWVSYRSGAGHIALHKQTARKRGPGSAVQIVLHVNDVAAARAALIARGASMTAVIDAGHGLVFCDGADPEGNLFQISTR